MNDSSQQKSYNLDYIAAELGLSKSTVSRAISGKGRISEATRKKVQKYIEELNYRPNMIAKCLSESKTYNIGVVIPTDSGEAESPFFQNCLMAISRECAMRDYDTVVIGIEKNDFSQLFRTVQNRKVDGMIVTHPISDGSIEEFLYNSSIPFVVIGKSSFDNAVCIDSTHKEGCKQLTSYLFMSTPPESVGLLMNSMSFNINLSRYEGFKAAFAAIGEEPTEKLVHTGIETPHQFSKAVAALLKENPKCIICGDDMICIRLLAELNNLGKSVPKDIKVASFYNSQYLDNYSPSITSLIFNAGELGATAAYLLTDILSGKEPEKETYLSFEMLIRKSTM